LVCVLDATAEGWRRCFLYVSANATASKIDMRASSVIHALRFGERQVRGNARRAPLRPRAW